MGFYQIAKPIVRVVLFPFYKIEAEYACELPQNEGFILASNHVSDMDPVMFGMVFPKQIQYMAKEELFRIPVLSPIIRKLGAFPVARGKGDQGAIENAVTVVKNGGVLGVYPEGTRYTDGKLHRAKSGAVLVASKTGGDILPACILYGKRHFLRRHVTIKFGKMIPNEELAVKEQTKTELRAANKRMMCAIAELMGVEAP